MGLFDYINRAIDTVVTTVKEAVTPQEVQKVSSPQKETVQMVSQETMANEKNEDTVNIKNKSIDSIYKQIDELCDDYRMSMEDVKKAHLLETIAGCSSEELTKKSDEEIKSYIDALKFVLKWQSWKLPWNDRDIDDIKDIAKKANERCIYLQTGGSFLGNLFRSNKTLSERLKNAGYNEPTPENVQEYFAGMIAEAVKTGDTKKIQEAYDDALKTFGEILIDTHNPQEKALLTAAIAQLEAGKRNLATKLSILSCGDNNEAKAVVAKGISDNYRTMTCKADELGNYTSDKDNIEMSQRAFQHMTEADSLAALAKNKAYAQELANKVERGEELTPEEQRFLSSVNVSYYSGAMIGSMCNMTYSNKENVLYTIDNDTSELGIQSQVYSTAANYVKGNQSSLTITTKAFTQAMDKATKGNYSAVLSGNNDCATNQQSARISNNNRNNINSSTKETTSNEAVSSNQVKTTNSQQTEKTSTVSNKHDTNRTTNCTTTNPINKTTNANSQIQANENPTVTQEVAIQGGVKEIKKFAKENNVSTFELAIDTLNTTNASSSTKKWALNQFKTASDSQQVLNFNKITHASSALAAANAMDDNTRSQLNTFRSYYIKETVENLEET